MFFSVDHLISRNAKFAIIWKVATSKTVKKVPKKSIISLCISDMCESILQRLPTGKGTMKEVNTKFSLYLIAQLLYGTTLVFDRQVTLLELDVRAAYESCKRVGFLSTLDWEISDQRSFVPSDKKRIRRSKVTFPEKLYEIPRNPLHIISLDELDQNPTTLRIAHHDEITLNDDVLVWKPPNVFQQDDDLQPPTDLEKLCFDNWNEDRSRKTSSKDSIENDPAFLDINIHNTVFNVGDTHLVAPGSEFDHHIDENINKLRGTVNLRDSIVSSVEFNEMGVIPDVCSDVFLPQQQVEIGMFDAILDEPQRQKAGEDSIELRRSQTPQILKRKWSSMDLISLDDDIAELARPVKKRRTAILTDLEDTTISYEEMKSMQLNYSSLIRSSEELKVNIAKSKCPTVAQLLLPYPTYVGNRFSKECRELYRSKKHIPMTYEDAAMLNLLEPINRGNDCELWRFDGSQDKSSKDLTDLQDCKANEDELHGIAFILETPERIKHAERSRSKSMSINEDRASNNIISQMDLIQVEENLSILSTEGRDSRASNLEQARRGTYTDRYSCLDGRPSSALFDPLPNSSIYGAASIFDHHPGRCSLPSEHFEDLSAARYRIEIALQRGGVIPLTQIIQPLTTSRKSAANIFATLLDMIKLKKVEVEQLTPYEEIWMWSASLKAN